MSATATTAQTIVITVTETTVAKYLVTAEQLKELDLPFDISALEAEDSDDVAVSLEEHLNATHYAVTEREVDFRPAKQ